MKVRENIGKVEVDFDYIYDYVKEMYKDDKDFCNSWEKFYSNHLGAIESMGVNNMMSEAMLNYFLTIKKAGLIDMLILK